MPTEEQKERLEGYNQAVNDLAIDAADKMAAMLKDGERVYVLTEDMEALKRQAHQFNTPVETAEERAKKEKKELDEFKSEFHKIRDTKGYNMEEASSYLSENSDLLTKILEKEGPDILKSQKNPKDYSFLEKVYSAVYSVFGAEYKTYDVNALDKNRQGPLHYLKPSDDVYALAVQKGADVNLKNTNGKTSSEEAVEAQKIAQEKAAEAKRVALAKAEEVAKAKAAEIERAAKAKAEEITPTKVEPESWVAKMKNALTGKAAGRN
jgi:hypothetical protein